MRSRAGRTPPAPGKRTRRTPEEARRLILDAARDAIARTGPEGLRLQDIAAAAGISHPLILHHFGSRAGLVRALTDEAVLELRDKLVAAMTASGFAIGDQVENVFEAFRDGLAQRLAWLATLDPETAQTGATMVQRDIVDHLHARRLATAPAETEVRREDTEFLAHLVAVAALGDALFGGRLRRSAGIEEGPEFDRRFRSWFAALLGRRAQADEGTPERTGGA